MSGGTFWGATFLFLACYEILQISGVFGDIELMRDSPSDGLKEWWIFDV